jgi:flagellar biogenesis protein FliO
MTGFLSFILGFVTGYLFRLIIDKAGKKNSGVNLLDVLTEKDVGRLIIVLIVTIVWAGTVLAELDPSNDYAVSPLIHGMMGTIVGYFFLIKAKNENGKSEKKS